MSIKLFINSDENKFILSNRTSNVENQYDSISDNINYIFGYCFINNDVLKNQIISDEEYDYIYENRNKNSGIYVVIRKQNNNISLLIDPLIQYNIFYHINGQDLTISNNIFLISKINNIFKEEERYIEDNIIYGSPMRGLTFVKDIFIYQYDDMFNFTFAKTYKKALRNKIENLEIIRLDNNIYKEFSYQDLITEYISNLKDKAKIISKKYDKVYIPLTGGADSRLVAAVFMEYDNVEHYCYGDGTRQDRLVSNFIIKTFNLKKANDVKIVGNTPKSMNSLLTLLCNSNSHKLSISISFNGRLNENICRVTGCYGANVSGGVTMPGENKFNVKYEGMLDPNDFNHWNYVDSFVKEHSNLREANLRDLFYLNNRGLSHYSCDSICENNLSNSFDILYDVINLEIVTKCEYSDNFIDHNAISIDIINKINNDLALSPYESRKIPKFRNFKNIPEINCFEKHIFPTDPVLKNHTYTRPIEIKKKYKILKNGHISPSIENIIAEFNDKNYLFKEYDKFIGNDKLIDKYNNSKLISSWLLSLHYLLSLRT